MKLKKHGKNTSRIEVLHISPFGFWISVEDREYFLSYEKYPWFKQSSVTELCDVQLLGEKHLFWPSLDVDLELDSLLHPENYPLVWDARV